MRGGRIFLSGRELVPEHEDAVGRLGGLAVGLGKVTARGVTLPLHLRQIVTNAGETIRKRVVLSE